MCLFYIVFGMVQFQPTLPPPSGQAGHPATRPAASSCHCNEIAKTLYDVALKSALFIAAGVVAEFTISAIAPPLFVLGASAFFSRLTLVIIAPCNLQLVHNVTESVAAFDRRYPLMKLVAIIAALALSLISIVVGAIVAVGAGIFIGCLIQISTNRQGIDQHRAEAAAKASAAGAALSIL